MPLPAYEEWRALREGQRRGEAATRLRALRQQVLARNRDLSPAAADALADRFIRDIIDDLVDEGEIRFECDGVRA